MDFVVCFPVTQGVAWFPDKEHVQGTQKAMPVRSGQFTFEIYILVCMTFNIYALFSRFVVMYCDFDGFTPLNRDRIQGR